MGIEVRNITKTFGTFTALRDVSLTVATGELVALLGPSGSGKTTLLRIIAGLEEPDDGSGAILFHDEDVARRQAGSRQVGFVFQHYALFRHMTVFENVAFGLRVRPKSHRPARSLIKYKVMRLLKLVQLESMANRYPHQLSGGQRQRVALARCWPSSRRCCCWTSRSARSTPACAQELRQWLRRLHDEIHLTSVFVTHDQDEALELADRVLVMNEGRIEQIGTPDEVFHHPATEFVVKFLGQVNVFHARLEGGKVHFATLAWESPELAGTPTQPARVFIRPHELDVDVTPNGHPSLEAVVTRIHSAGPNVRLELLASTGERLCAELTQERYRALGISNGSKVFVTPRDVKVFADKRE